MVAVTCPIRMPLSWSIENTRDTSILYFGHFTVILLAVKVYFTRTQLQFVEDLSFWTEHHTVENHLSKCGSIYVILRSNTTDLLIPRINDSFDEIILK